MTSSRRLDSLNPQRAKQVLEVNHLMSAARQRLRDGWHVFVPRTHDTFGMRELGRSRDLDGEVDILSGLRPGETVIVERACRLGADGYQARGKVTHSSVPLPAPSGAEPGPRRQRRNLHAATRKRRCQQERRRSRVNIGLEPDQIPESDRSFGEGAAHR